MQKFYQWKSLLIFVLSIVFLTACGAPLSLGGDALEITDTSGYTVKLKEPPDRIVVAGKAIFMVQDAVYLFPEASQRVVGLESRNQSAFNFLPVIADMEETETLEMNAGPEQVAALRPDLVLMKSYMAEKFEQPLEALDIPALYLDLETPEAFYQDIQVLGQVFQNPERAEEINNFYQNGVAQVQEAVANVREDQKPRVLLLRYSDKGGETAFYVPPAAWIQTTLVEKAGGRPVWADGEGRGGWNVVTLEQIAAWDPDQIFLIDYGGEADQIVDRLLSDSLWGELKAVQADELYAFPSDFYSWDQPDTRWILGLQWLTTKIHPDRAAQIDIRAEVKRFYTVLYGLDETALETDVLPLLAGDLRED